MKTSANGIKFIQREEGEVLQVYLDRSKIPTCGVGHVVMPGDNLHLGDKITQERCDTLLAHDLEKAETVINWAVKVPMTQNQFDALVSLTFNIGTGGFRYSTVLTDLNTGNLIDEKRAFELWDKDMQGGRLVVDAELLGRRDREVALFMKPDAAPAPVTINDAPPVLPDEGQPTPPGDLPPADEA